MSLITSLYGKHYGGDNTSYGEPNTPYHELNASNNGPNTFSMGPSHAYGSPHLSTHMSPLVMAPHRDIL